MDCSKQLEVPGKAKEDEIKILRAAEAAASKTTATESALKPEGSSSSWWPKLSLWTAKNSDDKTKTSTDLASNPTKKEEGKDAGQK
jgi:muconolactone delta-isomerase